MLLISLVIFSISAVFFMQRHFQMLQQNSYYPSRYFGWLADNFSVFYIFSFLIFIICYGLAFIKSHVFLIPISVIELVVSLIRWRVNVKTSIKKLVYTARIKRLLVSSVVIPVLFILLYCFYPSLFRLWSLPVIFISHFPFLGMFAAYYINMPAEKAVSNYYKKDAVKLLSTNKGLKVIGVTGSFGKTGVKFILDRILKEQFNVLATPGSYNTPLGVIRTVREKLRPETEIFIAEMGAKNIGDIKEICDICEPSVGIITAVGPQHLETFKTLDNVADTKFELADAVIKNGGKIYVNSDSLAAYSRAEKLDSKSVVYYGTSDKAFCRAENIFFSKDGCSFDLEYGSCHIKLSSKLLGKHNIINICGAAAIALDSGISEKLVKFAVSSLEQTEHRLQLKPFMHNSTLIDDAYNSNPVGCMEALNVLECFTGNEKIIVTPGLVELGDKEYEYNFELGKAAAEKCDKIILVGENRAVPMKDAIEKSDFGKDNLYIVKTFKEALEVLDKITGKNTVVLFENDLPDNYAG